jgi:hypothetical protein
MVKTPSIITIRRVINRETLQRLFTKKEISDMMHLSALLHAKPATQWFFCVFVFSVERRSPSALKLTVLSTTVVKIHKYSITPALLQVAPEIEIEEQPVWAEVLRAHVKADSDLSYRKLDNVELSEFTRFFMDNGAAEGVPPEVIIGDLDYRKASEKKAGNKNHGLTIVQ